MMRRRSSTVILLLIFTLLLPFISIPEVEAIEGDPTPVGWELLDSGQYLRIWNTRDEYFFNVSSGIQFSNHYLEFWSRNILGVGYYAGGEWNVLYWTDSLSNFERSISTDNLTYVNATLWKDLSYQSYDFRLAIRYYLGVDDTMLTVQPYIMNLGQDIPFDIGFAWRLKDIQISTDVYNDEFFTSWVIDENNTGSESYYLNQTLDKSYVANVTGYNVKDTLESQVLELYWSEGIIDKTKLAVKSAGEQYNAPVTLYVKVGTLSAGQEKTTEFLWHDADLVDSYTEATDGENSLKETHPSVSKMSSTGQSFTMLPSNYVITSCKFKMAKVGSPTGTGYAKLYAHSGTYGVSSVPTGSALATSDGFDVSTLGGGAADITFTFTGAEQYEMQANTYYCIVFENPTAGTIDDSNFVKVRRDSSSPTHDGNSIRHYSGSWGAQNSIDIHFYVYGDAAGDTTAPTYSDLGTNTTIAGDPSLFYGKWTDETNLTTGGYIFGTNNTGSWVNETWAQFPSPVGGTVDWSNVTKTLNSTIGLRVEWQFWANDTANNWNNTGIQFLITTSVANNAPVNDACTITNMDDSDNLYSQLRSYDLELNVSDADGVAELDTVQYALEIGAGWVNGSIDAQTNAHTFLAGSGNASVGTVTNTTSGNNASYTVPLTTDWDIISASDNDIHLWVNDTVGDDSSWAEKQTDYFDTVNDLVISGFTCDDDNGNLGATLTFTGTVYYEIDPGNGTASTSYPPDAEFTSVDVHNSTHSELGTDASIVNGAFSASVTAEATVGIETYHAYIDMSDADYTDGDESPTDTFIANRVKLLTLQVNSTTQALDQMAWYNCTFELEYDNHAGASGDSLTLEDSDGNSYIFAWNVTGTGVFEANHTESINVNRTLNTYASVNEATYGITILNMNGLSVVVQWGTGTPTFTIYIHVTNAQSAAIENATTMVSDYEDDSLEFSQLTNSTGYTDAETMTAGNYTLLVNKEDYQTYSTIFEFDESETVEVQLSALTARGFVLASGFLLALLVIPFGILIWWRR